MQACQFIRATINHLAALGVKSIKTGYTAELGEWRTRGDYKTSGIKDIFQAYLDYLPYYYEDDMPIDIFFTSFFRASKHSPDKYNIIGYSEEYNPEKTLLCRYRKLIKSYKHNLYVPFLVQRVHFRDVAATHVWCNAPKA